jgi:hypothetical protein
MCNYDEFDMGFSEFLEYHNVGGDRYKTLYSVSIYEFNLERKLLHIQDMDSLCFEAGAKILSKNYALKCIQAGTNPHGFVYVSEGLKNYQELIKTKHKREEFTFEVDTRGNVDQININVTNDVELVTESTLGVYLFYDVKLGGNGSQLFYSGAIQPSDYDTLDGLKFSTIHKWVRVIISSNRNYPFNAWFFNGSERCYFPEVRKSVFEHKLSLNRQIKDFEFRNIEVWPRRAYYFSLFAVE